MRFSLMRLLNQAVSALPIGSRYCCNCKHRLLRFLPYRGMKELPPLMAALGIVGSDIRQFTCPRCGCHDRERHLILYLQKIGMIDQFSNASILHFAPETHFSKIIIKQRPSSYIQCDLYPTRSDIQKVDILHIPFAAESFDFVIANHVLEHVSDDLVALHELHRVCKTGGYAILQTPYSSKLHSTLSDPGIDSDTARLLLYGQEDHVRLYGKDIFSRFSNVGFENCTIMHNPILNDVNSIYFGVNSQEPLFLFKRLR